ncbi:hypothetical protein [Gilvibacter sp. SZ-19]|jgi:hypothetical protein|uniref:hypothetical protein n=1 Tax=unclassified Gilvibacter TaxID=2625242 RepID=UPI000B3CE703|nr:hypothetical protein [Gilvibacter sp. SZ-19]ARV11039.1 hypothetical protein BTO09_01210 [Gilvibacter sp. SZ-19]
METLTPVTQKFKLIDGNFTAQEAQDLINALLNEKINFHKLQRLAACEGDLCADTRFPDGRIQELEAEKQHARAFINLKESTQKRFRINGTIELELIED